jgi:hypothetical protein
MPHYRVLLRGENFWLRIDERPRRMGFFTTRFVEAPDVEQAGQAALALLRGEGRLKPRNEATDAPLVFFDEIEEVQAADIQVVATGLSFYPDDRELSS